MAEGQTRALLTLGPGLVTMQLPRAGLQLELARRTSLAVGNSRRRGWGLSGTGRGPPGWAARAGVAGFGESGRCSYSRQTENVAVLSVLQAQKQRAGSSVLK